MSRFGKHLTIPLSHHIATLILRLALGGFMLTHGISKVESYQKLSVKFIDFLGMGSEFSLMLTIFSEVGCSVLLLLGLFTRFATIPLSVTMVVAAFVAHASGPFGDKEMALLYLSGYVVIFLMGAGRYSLDALLFRKK